MLEFSFSGTTVAAEFLLRLGCVRLARGQHRGENNRKKGLKGRITIALVLMGAAPE